MEHPSGRNTAAGIVLLCIIVGSHTCAQAQQNWPRFRGENGVGVSEQSGFPHQWSEQDYAWSIRVAGKGHSSPIVWGDRLFLTTATDTEAGSARLLLCLNPETGQQIWRKQIALDSSHLHKKNSWASGTPTTDGTLVYVVFADEKRHVLAAYDFEGNKKWTQDLGEFSSQHGQGTSPIVIDDLVVLPSDQMGPSQIVAFNKTTGDVVWRAKREFRKTSYATPMVLRGKDNVQLICVSGATGVTSLNPTDGSMNWQTEPFPMRTVASPVVAGGRIFASCGQGGQGTLMFGIDPGLTVKSAERIRIKRKARLPYVPTPLEYEGKLFLWTDRGIVVCLDPSSGKELWKDRVGGNFSGSPVCIDGKIYCISEAGEVVVIKAGPEFELLGRTSLGGPSYATPAVANGRLFLRTFDRLMCLKAKSGKQSE